MATLNAAFGTIDVVQQVWMVSEGVSFCNIFNEAYLFNGFEEGLIELMVFDPDTLTHKKDFQQTFKFHKSAIKKIHLMQGADVEKKVGRFVSLSQNLIICLWDLQ